MKANKESIISCILATKGDLVRLKRAIHCYLRQSHPKKELIIVSNGVPFINEAINRHLINVNDKSIILFTEKDDRLSIAELQNHALKKVSGDVICLWDENYQYHERRLEIQLSFLLEKSADATFFVEELQLFELDQILFVTDWTVQQRDQRQQMIPETLMMTKKSGLSLHLSSGISIIDYLLQQNAAISGLSGEVCLALRHVHEATEEKKNDMLQMAISKSQDQEKVSSQIILLTSVLKQYYVPTPLGIYSGNQQVGIYNL